MVGRKTARARYLSRKILKFYANKVDVGDNNEDNIDRPPDTNVFAAILTGINWWKHLNLVYPRLPKRMNARLKKDLTTYDDVDMRNLIEKFSKNPKRSDLPSIEQYLKIDLYCVYGGKYALSCIYYRPYRLCTKLDLRQVLNSFENVADHVRPMVVLQSSRPFFDELGTFHLIPTRKTLENFDSEWVSLWHAIVKARWPREIVGSDSFKERIQDMKTKIGLCENEKFAVTDRVFEKIRTLFGISIRLFFSNYVNDNRNIKTAFYSTIGKGAHGHLNLLVASVDEDGFAKEFRNVTNESYKRFQEEPHRFPALTCDREYMRRVRTSAERDRTKVSKILRWTRKGVYHSGKDRDRKSKFHQEIEKEISEVTQETEKSQSLVEMFSSPRPTPRQPSSDSSSEKVHRRGHRRCDLLASSSESDDEDGGDAAGVGVIREILAKNGDLLDDIPLASSSHVDLSNHVGYIASEGSSFDDDLEFDQACWANHEANAAADAEDAIPAGNRGFLDDLAADAASSEAAVFNDHIGGDDDDVTVISDDGGESRRMLLEEFMEIDHELPESEISDSDCSDYSATYRPILNVISATPNIFDSETRFKVLPDSAVKDLPRCPNKNCLFTTEHKRKMDQHIASCRGETKFVFKQSVAGPDVNDHITELFNEGFLPSADYFQEFFVTYDIECLMSAGPFSADEKFHNLVTIATYTSDQEKEIFERKDMRPESGVLLVARFVKHLVCLRKRLTENCPEEIMNGIAHYSALLKDKELLKTQSFDKRAIMKKKLRYLKDYLKLKIYGWFSETYDMAVLFPLVIVILWELANRDCKQLNLIKRGSGYMLIECLGLSFRDFKNYTAPMSLEKLADSCGLDRSLYCKGSFPYEWFTSPDQLVRSTNLCAYPAFHSTMTIKTKTYAKEMNEIIENYAWTTIEDIAAFLHLESLVDDPVVIEACGRYPFYMPMMDAKSPEDYFAQHMSHLNILFKYDEEKQCLQCEPEDENAQDYFRFSPLKYVECVKLWEAISDQINRRATMMEFLYEYNFNDVKLLEGSIRRYAGNYKENHGVGIHGDLSIAAIAQKLAYVSYDKDFPPIYSIPPSHALFYKKCREKLSGGICQALHRAVNLNGPSDIIPKSAWQAPNGKPFKCCSMLDFNSLYPYAFMGDMPGGPGIFFHRRPLPYRNSNVQVDNETGETESRFFAEGMFAQRENTSLQSIQWLEYMNWSEKDFPRFYGGKIKHSYNLREKKIGDYYIDGYCELGDRIILFEFRGCTYHTCPYCRKKPFRGMRVKVDGKYETITAEQLKKRDDDRIFEIVKLLRQSDGIDDDCDEPKFDVESYKIVSSRYELVVEYACRWLKKWRQLVISGEPPKSNDYPFLFESSYSKFTGQEEGTEGVTDEMFRNIVGENKFFGFALVDLKSPQHVVDKHKFIPPIFDKVRLELEDVQGHLKNMLNLKQLSSLFPREENCFVYNTNGYLITSDMLKYYHDKGIEFYAHYFVTYYRGAPFKNFVKKMVKERVNARDTTSSTVSKLIMNSCVGRFALAKHRFTETSIYGINRMYKALRNPLLKGTKSLRSQDVAMDPLHEVEMKRRTTLEDLAIHVQIQVYQNSKLLFFKFLDVLDEFCEEGAVVFTYCDTDSFLLAMTETELVDCVKPHLRQRWHDEILPKWFATADPASQKEPGLLKEEARITRGWWLSISPKCYVMADMDSDELERQIVDPANEHRCFEILQQAENIPNVKIAKKSAKGCKRSIPLSFYEYLISIFGVDYNKRVTKRVPQIQWDRKRDQMKTWVFDRKVINPILSKRIIATDKISTLPLRRANGDLI
jgi:hypothetical protein